MFILVFFLQTCSTLINPFCFVDAMEMQIANDNSLSSTTIDDNPFVHIKVLFFARACDITRLAELPLDVSSSSTTQDCLNKLVAKSPNLEDINGCMVLALNKEYTTESAIVKDKDDLAFIPPISGA